MPKTAFQAKMDKLIQEGNSWLLKGAEPYFGYEGKLESSPNKTALLFIHGYTSSPQEIKGIAKYFAEKGYAVSLPLLPGHGTAPKYLRDQRWMDWYQAAEKALKDLLKAGYENIILMGSSVGCNLSLLLSFQYKKYIKAQVWITPALRLRKQRYLRTGTFLINRFLPFWRYKNKRRIDEINTVADQSVFEDRVAYANNPFKVVEEVYRINDFARRTLYKLETPVLVLIGKQDMVLHHTLKQLLIDGIDPRLLKIIELENSKHLLSVDYDKEDVRRHIADYIKEFI